MKYVLVCGGVLSGVGKGVVASSAALLLKCRGHKVTMIKIDPYLNIDAGTMSPFEHGEVFVLNDGGEVDLDLGNYERFVDVTLTRDHNITTGKIFQSIIEKERRGDFLGKTVQTVPHLVDEIQAWVERVALLPVDGTTATPDVCIIELGGTVGDLESGTFIGAFQRFQRRVGAQNFCVLFVALVPALGKDGEQKTKPAQQAAMHLRQSLWPDLMVCRSTMPLCKDAKAKLAENVGLRPENVIGVHDVSNIYHVPLLLEELGLSKTLTTCLGLPERVLDTKILNRWRHIANTVDGLGQQQDVHVAIVGKYTGLTDSYLSLTKALQHSTIEEPCKLHIDWVKSTDLEQRADNQADYAAAFAVLQNADAILVPGGFGARGSEGCVFSSAYARASLKPYLGICLGMQLAVVDICRAKLGWKDANSQEFDDQTEHDVIVFMPEVSKTHMGGTLRLGTRRTLFTDKNSLACRLYGSVDYVDERHRHRYEVNPKMVEEIEKGTPLRFVGKDETGTRMEIAELPQDVHPFFVGTQYHPEYLTRPDRAHRLFVGFMAAAKAHAKQNRPATPPS